MSGVNRILAPTFEYPPDAGGIGRYVEMIKFALPELQVLRLEGGKRFYRYFFELWGRRSTFDALIVNGAFPLGTVAVLLRKPFYLIFHGNDFDLGRRTWWRRRLMKRYMHKAVAVIANSKALAREIEAFSEREVEVLYPSLAPGFEKNDTTPIPTERFTALTIARLVDRKGIDLVLEAMREIPDMDYLIIGSGPDEGRLKKLAEGLGARVRFLGRANDQEKAEAYRKADVFIMTPKILENDREGFGIVYLEAGYFGLPVIATKTKGVDEAVIDGETGILVGEGELREGVERLRDAKERKRLGEGGKRRVERDGLAKHRIDAIKRIVYGG